MCVEKVGFVVIFRKKNLYFLPISCLISKGQLWGKPANREGVTCIVFRLIYVLIIQERSYLDVLSQAVEDLLGHSHCFGEIPLTGLINNVFS